jgi:PKD repeat protein
MQMRTYTMRRISIAICVFTAAALRAQSSCPTQAPSGFAVILRNCGYVAPCLAGTPVTLDLMPIIADCPPPPPGYPSSCPSTYVPQACDVGRWNFGDGTAPVAGAPSGPVPAHTYTAPGVYTLSGTISNSLGSAPITVTAPVVVTPNPPAYVEFSQNEITVPETVGSITFTLIRSGNLSLTSKVHYAHAEGSGQPVGQGESIAGDLIFAPGETTKTFTMRVYDDQIYSSGVFGFVTATAKDGTPFRFNGAPDPLAVEYYNLTENDPPPSAIVSDVRVVEGAETADFTVTMSAPMALWASFYTTLAEGTAKAGVDYRDVAPFCDIPPGSTQCTLRVPLINDFFAELDKTFTLTLRDIGAQAPTYARKTATCTILNDDAPITPAAVQVAPGARITMKLDGGQTQASPLTVPLQSSEPQVVEVPASVTIEAGQSSASFTARAVSPGRVRITPSIPGMTAPPAIVTVVEPVSLAAQPPALAMRPGGDASVIVSLVPPRNTLQVLSLWSTRPDIATMPDSLTIPAGASATFTVHAVADGVATIWISTSDGFTFNVDVTVADGAAVARIDPASAPASGGMSVTIVGQGLDARCSVSFGGAPATDVKAIAGGLSVVVPAHAPGPVDVDVVCGAAHVTLRNGFTFLPARRRAAG